MAGYACDACRRNCGEVPRHRYTTMDGGEYMIALDYVRCGNWGGATIDKREDCGDFEPCKRRGTVL